MGGRRADTQQTDRPSAPSGVPRFEFTHSILLQGRDHVNDADETPIDRRAHLINLEG